MVNTIRRNPLGGLNVRRYFPSARTIMLVRFDPGTKDPYRQDEIRDELNPSPSEQARRTSPLQRQARSLATGPQALSQGDFRAALTNARINIADAVAQLPRPDGLSRVIDLQPTRSTRRANTYRKADELSVTIPWKAAPFDARIIRAILLFHYEGTVSADQWGSSQRAAAPNTTPGEGYLVPATGENLRFVGLADTISDSHGAGGDSIEIKARDLTAPLLDTTLPPGVEVRIQAGDTIATVIRRLLDTNDAFELIRGPFLRTEGGRLPQLDASRYPRLAVPPKERHREDRTGGRPYVLRYPPKQGNVKYWDAITELCVSHCLRPAIEQDKLVLLEPRVLYKRNPEDVTQPGVPLFPTPFRRAIGDATPIRRMVYGDNVENLRFNRKLSGVRAPTIEVVSRNPDAERADRRLLTERYPPQKRANDVDAAGKKPQEKFHRVAIRGVIDRSQLREIARQVYEGIARQELGIVFSTSELASYSDHPQFDPNADPDLLALTHGDPIQLLVTPTERRTGRLFSLTELNSLVERNKAQARAGGDPALKDPVAFLVSQGWSDGDARQLTRILRSANLPSEFRVIGVSFTFDGEGASGFTIQVDARDYVRVRADPDDFATTGGPGAVGPGDRVGAKDLAFGLEDV